MTRSFRIGRIAGIDIEVDYTWFIIFFLVAATLSVGIFKERLPGLSLGARWLVAAGTTLLFFGSVLAHELAHSVVAKRHGLDITGITLFLFGGVSKMSDEPKSASDEFKIAIVGPLTSLVLAGIFLGIGYAVRSATGGHVVGTVFWWLGWVNAMLGAFNLLPGFPLDGGRVLRAGIWAGARNLWEATRIASMFGQGMGILMIVGGVAMFFVGGGLSGLWLAFIGWFLIQSAQASYQQLVLRQALPGLSISQVMTSNVESVPADTTLDRVIHDYVLAHNHPAFPVMDDSKLLGLICINDIRSVPREQWSQTTAREAVPRLTEQHSLHPDTDAWEALQRMVREDCGRLLVVDHDGALRGIVSRTDIMRAIRTRMGIGQ